MTTNAIVETFRNFRKNLFAFFTYRADSTIDIRSHHQVNFSYLQYGCKTVYFRSFLFVLW